MNPAALLETLRSLSYGGALGGAFGAVLYYWTPRFAHAGLSQNDVIMMFGLLGSAAHRIIDAVIVNIFFRPVGRFIGYYTRIGDILIGKRMGVITPEQASEYLRALSDDYYLRGLPRANVDRPALPGPPRITR